MTNLTEASTWDDVLQLETTHRVLGGPGGISNQQPQSLLNRTKWLRDALEALASQVGDDEDDIANNAAAIALLGAIVSPLPNMAALTAIVTPADGLIRHVKGFGFWVFDALAAATGVPPNAFAVAPDDESPGAWISSTMHEESKKVVVPCANVRGITTDGAGGVQDAAYSDDLSFGPPAAAHVIVSDQGFYPIVVYTGGSVNAYGFYLSLDEFLVDGATLAKATLYMHPHHGGRAALPTRLPQLRLVRKSRTGYNTSNDSLLSTVGVSPNPADVAAWEADQTVVFTPDQNNLIQRDTYSYGAIIFDEAGTNAKAGNRYGQLLLEFSGIADARRS